jgi:hypothetical protein
LKVTTIPMTIAIITLHKSSKVVGGILFSLK